ncbi:hypothetical protein BGW80DRAFT_1442360 [Lactifluus volemus]|nr:hypothetical protein BGW80DRAFT_1442360 [Lactifluus volemus]
MNTRCGFMVTLSDQPDSANLRILAAVVQVPIDMDDRLNAIDDSVRWNILYHEGCIETASSTGVQARATPPDDTVGKDMAYENAGIQNGENVGNRLDVIGFKKKDFTGIEDHILRLKTADVLENVTSIAHGSAERTASNKSAVVVAVVTYLHEGGRMAVRTVR